MPGYSVNTFIELDKNKFVDEEEYNSKKYDIKFTEKAANLSPTQFEIKRILDEKFQKDDTRTQAIEDAIEKVSADSKGYARDILNNLYNKIFVEKLIRYTEIQDMKQDDALEMFVRFNSGGKTLKKYEITMSILEVYWPNAKAKFGNLLTDSYTDFGVDFIVRSAFMLYGDVVKANLNRQIVEDLKNHWPDFKKALETLENVLRDMKIEVSHFSKRWNVLLPIVYFIYYNPNYENNLDGIRAYLIRAVLFIYFRSGTPGKLQQMRNSIKDNNYEITVEALEQMDDLRVTDGRIDDILNSVKGSSVAEEALYFLNLDWTNKNLKYEQDHLHPSDRFDQTKPTFVSMEDWSRWKQDKDRLPNLQLLEGRSNGSKNDMSLMDYYNDMNDEQKARFRKEALIPDGVSLELDHFREFYEKRKELLRAKLRQLLG